MDAKKASAKQIHWFNLTIYNLKLKNYYSYSNAIKLKSQIYAV